MAKSVAIQGIKGCFHDEAAQKFFCNEQIATVDCDTFASLAEKIKSDPSLLGVLAIENTIAGSLLQNHDIISKNDLRIIGEYKMRISHSLAALPGQDMDDIIEVNSHPMALMQCEEFLSKYPRIKVIEKFDTAGSAKEISENKLAGHAAICSSHAAEVYGLEVIESGIETNKHNFTRFLIVAHPLNNEAAALAGKPDKASIVFTLPHSQGALSKVLTILAFYDLNLTKIQSFPIVGREWEYKFYVDLTFDDTSRYRQGLEAVKPLTSGFKILGEYESCKKIL